MCSNSHSNNFLSLILLFFSVELVSICVYVRIYVCMCVKNISILFYLQKIFLTIINLFVEMYIETHTYVIHSNLLTILLFFDGMYIFYFHIRHIFEGISVCYRSVLLLLYDYPHSNTNIMRKRY